MSKPEKQEAMDEVGQLVRASGVSAAELARRAGVAPSTVTRALDPNFGFVPRSETMRKLRAAALGDAKAPSPQVVVQGDGRRVLLQINAEVSMATAAKIMALLEGEQ